jgi:hypothetical protein
MAEEFEYAQLIVDNIVLQGQEADLVSSNAVSKSYVDAHIASSISSLVNGAGPALDTLKEIADALGNDSNLASVLTTAINAVQTALTAEVGSRSTAVQSVISDFNTEKGIRDAYRVSDRAEAKSANDTEKDERKVADGLLSGSIDVLTADAVQDRSNATTAYNAIDVRINDEQTARQGVYNDLSSLLQEESSSRVSSDNSINDSITAAQVETARVESSLESKVTDEAKSRQDADDLKFNKSGGSVSGDMTLDSYLNFGVNWRVKASANGSKIIFQHMKADGIWRTALPFICSV